MPAWSTDAAQRAPPISLRAVEAARVHHPQVTEREIVLDRIRWVQHTERGRDLLGHPPAWAAITGELQALTDAHHVSVERDH